MSNEKRNLEAKGMPKSGGVKRPHFDLRKNRLLYIREHPFHLHLVSLILDIGTRFGVPSPSPQLPSSLPGHLIQGLTEIPTPLYPDIELFSRLLPKTLTSSFPQSHFDLLRRACDFFHLDGNHWYRIKWVSNIQYFSNNIWVLGQQPLKLSPPIVNILLKDDHDQGDKKMC
jgi:hypothetical protein